MRSARTVLAAALLLLLPAAARAPRLEPGRWQLRTDPGHASLDGVVLNDLPIDPVSAQTLCVTPADAAAPAAWFARETAATCTLTRSDIAGGTIAIAGTCAPATPGGTPGELTLTGHWTPRSVNMHFRTIAHGENGTMGFTGHIVGHRIGACGG